MDREWEGRCRCGQVRFSLRGEPKRTGICHCTNCRRETGSAFNYFGVWPREAFDASGAVATWEGHSFCPTCGAGLYGLAETEVEVKLGSLEVAPTGLAPVYELWTVRRETWLDPLRQAEQHERDRTPPP